MIFACGIGHRFEGKNRDIGRPCPRCGLPLSESPAPAADLMLTADEHDMLATSGRCVTGGACGHLEVLHIEDENGRRCLVLAAGQTCPCTGGS